MRIVYCRRDGLVTHHRLDCLQRGSVIGSAGSEGMAQVVNPSRFGQQTSLLPSKVQIGVRLPSPRIRKDVIVSARRVL